MRHLEFLRLQYRAIAAYAGLIALIVGGLIASPVLLLPFFPDEAGLAWGFVLPGGVLAVVGALAWRLLRPKEPPALAVPGAAVIVVLSWAAAVLAGAVPFMLVSGLGLTRAVFESTSGWTTTGLSVVDVTTAPHLVLFYRSVTQLAGGAGIAVLMLAVFGGPLGPWLSTAEGRDRQLVPHVRRSAKLVLTIYTGYAVLGFLALWAVGMGAFDAVNHAFAAVSTGGFSTRPESVGYWDSPAVEAVVIVLMVLGNLNFLTAWALLKGRFRAVARNGEVRLQALLYPACTAVIFLGFARALYPALGKAARVAVFETVTALTTTGFSTVGYGEWPALGWLVLIGLMLVGGGACSTAGGMKQYRVYVLWRGLLWELKRMVMPANAVTEPDVWQGERREFLGDGHLRQVGVFAFLYLAFFGTGAVVLAAHGYSLAESVFEFASALGTVGLSVGVTAADAPAAVLWTETIAMLLGRLEFLVVVMGIARLASDARSLAIGPSARR